MNKYEAMVIVKPDLSEEERKALFSQINDTLAKNQGNVSSGAVWAEKRKLYFPIKKHNEGLYYLLNFSIAPASINELRRAFKLNESILRVMITRAE